MPDVTPLWALPLIATNQAQKDVTHNEAVSALEVLANLIVESAVVIAPPQNPIFGQCWIIAAAATDEWLGQDFNIAMWSAGGWRFFTPYEGVSAWSKGENLILRYQAGIWQSGGFIANPIGGLTVDVEARASLNIILNELRNHGIIAS